MTGFFRQPLTVPRRWILLVAITAGVLVTGAVAKIAMQHGIAWHCPALRLLHIPCPSCGSTRALAFLAQGNFCSALRFNPLIALSACAAPLISFPGFRRLLGRAGWVAFFGAVLLNWIYLLFFLPR